MTGFEPVTPSLPRKYSTPELHRLKPAIDRKIIVGRAGFEPAKVKTSRFTVCPRWPLEYLPKPFTIF